MKHESANLDLLRTIAVALVVVCHVGTGLGWDQSVFNLQALGRSGVAFFFVHTSLVLMKSLERTNGGALAFYVRRVFRIYPLAVAIVLVCAIQIVLSGTYPDLGFVVANLFLVQNITGHPSILEVMWTLPYEVQMYLVLPALFALTRSPRATLSIAALWLAGLIVSVSGSFPLLVYVPCFLAGVFAYTLRASPKGMTPLVLFTAAVVCALAASMLEAKGFSELPLLWGVSAVVGALIPFSKEIPTGWLSRASSVCARYSYSIYLTHMFALFAGIRIVGGPVALQLLASAAALFAFVRVTDRWIEQPGIALGKRLASRLQTVSAGSAVVRES